MTWHYQVMRTVHEDGSVTFGIHEYYRGLENWTENPVTPQGESVEDLERELKRMLNDLQKYPVRENK